MSRTPQQFISDLEDALRSARTRIETMEHDDGYILDRPEVFRTYATAVMHVEVLTRRLEKLRRSHGV